MIVCPACHHRNPEGAADCQHCGESLAQGYFRVCPSCDALNPPERVFCSRCLSRLDAAGQPDAPSAPVIPSRVPATPPQAASPAAPVPAPETPQIEAEEAGDVQWEPGIQTVEDALRSLGEIAEEPPATEPQAAPPVVLEQPPVTPQQPPAAPEPPAAAQQPQPQPTASSAAPATAAPEPVMRQASQPPMPAQPEAHQSESQPPPAMPDSLPAALEGIEAVLPLQPAVFRLGRGLVPAPEPPHAAAEAADAETAAALFHRIATEPARLAAPIRTVIRRPSDRLPRLGRTLLYLLVLLAALTPFFSGGQTQSLIEPSDAVSGLTRVLSSVPAGATVLLAFDYGPGYAGELDPLAQAVARFLAGRSVRVLALTTRPEGVGLARRVLDAAAEETEGYVYGEDYAILGYLPGDEVGLRTLNLGLEATFVADSVTQTPLGELAVTRDLAGVESVQRIIILADDGQSVRRWIEQVGSRHDVALDALVTAAVEPMLTPYRQSGQLGTLVAAATGAAEFEIAAGVQAESAGAADGLVALFLLLALVAVFTNVAYVVRGDRNTPSSTPGAHDTPRKA
ncbi:MAG: zinc ribbon domain-containing protein [Anaerolineae bacterium]